MRVDFYLLDGGASVAATLPLLASKVLGAGGRLVVVEADAERREALSRALWSWRPESFLANGLADGSAADAAQPILIAPEVSRANGADIAMLADGQWRECGMARVLLMFDDEQRPAAREIWRLLAAREGVERRFWKQADGRWVEGP